jgi:hypothetical protein
MIDAGIAHQKMLLMLRIMPGRSELLALNWFRQNCSRHFVSKWFWIMRFIWFPKI